MLRIVTIVILAVTIFLCAKMAYKRQSKMESVQPFVSIDTARLNFRQVVYVPVHANIYLEKGSRHLKLTTVLKIRNTSSSDSIYVFRIEYYDTEGVQLKSYVDSVFLIKPMATAQIFVKHDEFKKRGDNFIVEWRADNPKQFPLIQALSSDPGSKFVLTTEGVSIETAIP